MKADLQWVNNMSFKCNNHGIATSVDASKEHGGNDLGPTPKELVLNAMMSCTAMDVVAILKKMRQDIAQFQMSIEVELTKDHPIHFQSAALTYNLAGEIQPDKAIKAVDSSLTKYCGVNYMISRVCPISYTIILNGQEIKQGLAAFP